MATYVLVHGGWDGGWAWQGVGKVLQSNGHAVYRPTLTGSGERVHLASPNVDLETLHRDIVNVIRYENLNDVILVGHSYGGYVMSGVAERIPERLNQLVFLDAFAPEDGETIADMVGAELMAWFNEQARNLGEGWRIPHFPPDADRRTDLLVKPGQQPQRIQNPAAARLKHTYVEFTAKPLGDPLQPVMARMAERAKAKGWQHRTLAVDHFPLLDKPAIVANLLMELL